MGRLLFCTMVMFAVMGLHAPSAFAQDEFEAFRSKLNKAKGDGGADGVSSKPATISGSPDDEDEPLDAGGGAGALGPAGALPVAGGGGAGGFGVAGTPQTPEELQALMEAEQEETKRKFEEQTFQQALKQLLPLKPEQIRKTLETFRITREAAETPITEPEPKQEVLTASLDPADAPLVIKTGPGLVTTVTVLDATGAPWPIQDLTWAGAFAVLAPENGGHVIRITPKSAHGTGNVSMRLIDMITPVTMRLVTGLDWVHYRLDVRIPKPGPLARTPIIEYGGLKTVAGKDAQMVSFLEGTPPEGAEKMIVEGADPRTTAWLAAGRTYLRTPLTLLSPGWDASVTSADGTTVYSIGKTPVVLLSDEGRMVKARIFSVEEVTP